jgi:TetR/AcrR family transcriptional regulator
MNIKASARKLAILQGLAQMLEQPTAGRVTTAALAAHMEVSEAALYRHFASKAQMFEGLFEFIEETIFQLINHIKESEQDRLEQARQAGGMLLTFAKRNRGMTRVLTGDALVNEDTRLQTRVAQISQRIESSFKQMLREAVSEGQIQPEIDIGCVASVLTHYILGRWLRFAQSGWTLEPTDQMLGNINLILGASLLTSSKI